MEKTNSLTHISERNLLSRVLTLSIENRFSFALWRLPDTSTVQLAASDRPHSCAEVNLEEEQPGFIFSPFLPSQKKIFLPGDELFSFESGRLTLSKGTFKDKVQTGNDSKNENAGAVLSYYTAPPLSQSPADEKSFQQLVVKCREEIIRGNFEKIVPSRSKRISLPAPFDLLDIFSRLCQKYPAAMVSVFSSPLTGTWVGATPELLVSVSRDQQFHTVALAGTQPFEEGIDLRSVTWTQKDIEEQALVERYVISCFKKIRLREYNEHGPKTIVAGNVLHLKTDFDVDMMATNFPQLGSVMLQLLHPTSAVCGMPLDRSLAFLKEHEGYDRQFYSGYLGPVNMQQESHLYVNLRCMQLFSKDAILYAGAGVMADSDPEKEWFETEMKMNTLDQIIRM